MTTPPPRYRVLACASMARPVFRAASRTDAVVTVELLPQGLHDRPRQLRTALQERIDATDPGEVDAVLLVYGLCGGGTAGLVAPAVPLVLARAHDCITLRLGSRARFDEEFRACPGTYWMSRDFLERNRRGDVATLGVSPRGYQDLVDKHGPENAAYIAEVMQRWAANYQRLVYLESADPEPAAYRQEAEQKARRWQLAMETRASDHRLVDALLAGDWGPEFLVVGPGRQVAVGSAAQVVMEQHQPVHVVPATVLPEQKGNAG